MSRNLRAFYRSLILVGCLASMAIPTVTTAQLEINGVPIRGGEYTIELTPSAASGQLFQTYVSRVAKDGFDQVMFRDQEGRLWLHYGRHLLLYASSADRVNQASFKGDPVTVIHIDDENQEIDIRQPLGRRIAAILVFIVLVGIGLGVLSGLVARRNFIILGKNPLWDHTLYGLVVGVIVALLVYGLIDRRFDPDKLTATYTHDHLKPFTLNPPD